VVVRVNGWRSDSTVALGFVGLAVDGASRIPGGIRPLVRDGEFFVRGAARDSVWFTEQGLRFVGRRDGDVFSGTVELDPDLVKRTGVASLDALPEWRLLRLDR
jgi:hypothetical protein